MFHKLSEYVEHIAMIGFFTILGMGIYAFSSNEPPKTRAKNTILGGLIAAGLSYPTWVYFGQGQMWTLILITITYTITGQFIPEFLQKIIPKAARRIANIVFKNRFGEDLNDDSKR